MEFQGTDYGQLTNTAPSGCECATSSLDAKCLYVGVYSVYSDWRELLRASVAMCTSILLDASLVSSGQAVARRLDGLRSLFDLRSVVTAAVTTAAAASAATASFTAYSRLICLQYLAILLLVLRSTFVFLSAIML